MLQGGMYADPPTNPATNTGGEPEAANPVGTVEASNVRFKKKSPLFAYFSCPAELFAVITLYRLWTNPLCLLRTLI